MTSNSSLPEFECLVSEAGLSTGSLSVDQGIELMLQFYRHRRAEDCPMDAQGADMLLYQWGMSHWEKGEVFVVNLTRQFIAGEESDDEDIWQLSLDFVFSPTEALRAIESGNKWCPNAKPRGVDYFEGFVRSSSAFQAVSAITPVAVALDYFNAG